MPVSEPWPYLTTVRRTRRADAQPVWNRLSPVFRESQPVKASSPPLSVPDWGPSRKVLANAAAHHLCVVANVEVPAGPEGAVRDAARDWGETDVFPFR